MGTLDEAIQEIAKTIEQSPALEEKANKFIADLSRNQKEFSVLTENQSYQEIISSIIHADISAFVAKGGSTNVIQGSTVNSERTQLHATDNSKNFVDGTTFKGSDGAVSMQGITTQGPISVQFRAVELVLVRMVLSALVATQEFCQETVPLVTSFFKEISGS